MSQTAFSVVGRVCPKQLIESLEQIRCSKFGRGAGGHQAEVGTLSQLWDILFFDGFPKQVKAALTGSILIFAAIS